MSYTDLKQRRMTMPLVAAKCTSCGAALTVDNSKDAAICEFCGTPFIVEKAITNVTMSGNNSITVESAVINIQSGNNAPSVNNLLKRAEEFEQQGNFVTAVEYYEKVLDLDYSNTIARESINRITNSPILSIPISGGFIQASLSLTRKSLTYQTKRKTEVYPIESIVAVERFVARLMIGTNNRQKPLDLAIGSVKNAKAMEQALKTVLAERQHSR